MILKKFCNGPLKWRILSFECCFYENLSIFEKLTLPTFKIWYKTIDFKKIFFCKNKIIEQIK